MTCVLSIPALCSNPFSEGDAKIRNKGCESFDFSWMNAQHQHSGLSDNQRCASPGHVPASTGSSISCGMEISSRLSASIKHQQFNMHTEGGYKTDINAPDSEKHFSTNGKHGVSDLFDMCNKTIVGAEHMNVTKHGVKRKAETTVSEEAYFSPKRVSPFFNTPKERKDERKKILKISIKKLQQLEDPEAFLRRTVLVNNTTKRLQTELRQEIFRTKTCVLNKRFFSGYGVPPNNNCMSDTYLFDDPFLSGANEKITDDMTDTLINNVFDDKTNYKTKDSDVGAKTDILANEMEVPEEQVCIRSGSFNNLLNVSEDNSNQNTSDDSTESITFIQPSKECRRLTCLDIKTDTRNVGCRSDLEIT